MLSKKRKRNRKEKNNNKVYTHLPGSLGAGTSKSNFLFAGKGTVTTVTRVLAAETRGFLIVGGGAAFVSCRSGVALDELAPRTVLRLRKIIKLAHMHTHIR